MTSSINVPLNENLVNQIIKTWGTQMQQNKERINELQKENNELSENIKLLMASLNPVNTNETQQQQLPLLSNAQYHPEWTIFRKVVYFLQDKKQPLATREIIELIIEKEPDQKDARKNLVAAVSGVLSAKAKSGKLKRSENYLGENAYELA